MYHWPRRGSSGTSLLFCMNTFTKWWYFWILALCYSVNLMRKCQNKKIKVLSLILVTVLIVQTELRLQRAQCGCTNFCVSNLVNHSPCFCEQIHPETVWDPCWSTVVLSTLRKRKVAQGWLGDAAPSVRQNTINTGSEWVENMWNWWAL